MDELIKILEELNSVVINESFLAKLNELHETQFECSRFYRGDDRAESEIKEKGFAPIRQASEAGIINFLGAVASIKKIGVAQLLAMWNEFRSSLETAKYGEYFVSASFTDAQKGKYKYIITFPVNIVFYDVIRLASGPISIGVYNHEGVRIRVLKLNKNEAVFLDPIPAAFIQEDK
ncbi:MAG: hypothetical protein IK003_03620 [Prevotella sp.]|nr:hypothetical protein [Prevotella sp.]